MTPILTPSRNLEGKKAQMLPVLLFIHAYRNKLGYSPTQYGFYPSMREIAKAFPNPTTKRMASTNTVFLWINKLVDIGWVHKRNAHGLYSLLITKEGMQAIKSKEKKS